ncbi:MAG: hypothetical protein JXB88_00450 [Spirochaetales bacterium]|nr:hypothetical protein [Spirochaetales bacterium]
MKMTPGLLRVQDNMAPGRITGEGFLGDDNRALTDIIQADEETVAALGMDWEIISGKLQSLLDQGKHGLGNPVTIQKKWLITVHETRGHLPCPFGDGLYRKHTAEVEHLPTKTRFHFSELSLHLLKAHHFLQGRGSSFRLEPGLLKKVSEWTN